MSRRWDLWLVWLGASHLSDVVPTYTLHFWGVHKTHTEYLTMALTQNMHRNHLYSTLEDHFQHSVMFMKSDSSIVHIQILWWIITLIHFCILYALFTPFLREILARMFILILYIHTWNALHQHISLTDACLTLTLRSKVIFDCNLCYEKKISSNTKHYFQNLQCIPYWWISS